MTTALFKLAVFLGLVLWLIWMAAGFYARLSENAVTYRYISDALDQRLIYPSRVTWLPPDRPLDRPMTYADEEQVEKIIDKAWSALTLAQITGDSAVLTDSFTGVAYARAEQAVAEAHKHGGLISVLSSTARPVFFHKDASLLQLEVDTFAVRALLTEDRVEHHSLTRDRNIVTLLNGDYGWRISNLRRIGNEPAQALGVAAPKAGRAGFNYYPAATPWTLFWSAYEPAIIETDFARIRNLGADSIRIFLTYDAFLDPETSEQSVERLRHLLATAEKNGLSVVPTLFDLKSDFSPVTWVNDAAYLDVILPIVSEAASVIYVDLKNESDLDFKAHGKAKTLTWLKTMLAYMRDRAPELAATVGWSNAASAPLLVRELDVVSYHDYANVDEAGIRFQAVKAAAAGKPVAVTEIGYSAYAVLFGLPSSPRRQADKLAQHLDALRGADGVYIWTLHDFVRHDAAAIGRSPWRRRLETKFGLLDAKGREKPAAGVFRNTFAQGQ